MGPLIHILLPLLVHQMLYLPAHEPVVTSQTFFIFVVQRQNFLMLIFNSMEFVTSTDISITLPIFTSRLDKLTNIIDRIGLYLAKINKIEFECVWKHNSIIWMARVKIGIIVMLLAGNTFDVSCRPNYVSGQKTPSYKMHILSQFVDSNDRIISIIKKGREYLYDKWQLQPIVIFNVTIKMVIIKLRFLLYYILNYLMHKTRPELEKLHSCEFENVNMKCYFDFYDPRVEFNSIGIRITGNNILECIFSVVCNDIGFYRRVSNENFYNHGFNCGVLTPPTPAPQRPEMFILDGNGTEIPGNIVLESIFDDVKYKIDKVIPS